MRTYAMVIIMLLVSSGLRAEVSGEADRDNVNLLTSLFPASNSRFRSEFGWTPRYPGYREGLDQIITEWKTDGFLN